MICGYIGPIVGMTFGMIVWDLKMFWTSFRNELLGLLVCWISGAIMGLAVGTLYNVDNSKGPMGDNTEMSSRGQYEALYWGSIIAFASGIGVALGTSSYQISALIGVAISAALLPPIVNSGVCLGASLIMFVRPNQSDHIIIHTWVKTGIISMTLFLINWVLLFISAIIMLRLKNLHSFANAAKIDQNYSKFNKLVDHVQVIYRYIDIYIIVSAIYPTIYVYLIYLYKHRTPNHLVVLPTIYLKVHIPIAVQDLVIYQHQYHNKHHL